MITVVPYDPQWPEQFRTFRNRLSKTLRGVPVITIEHVGSTSVPGLAAKPIIDIDIMVAPTDVTLASDALVRIGFEARGDLGVADRFAFFSPESFADTHIYVVVNGCVSLRNHLAVRDVLRANRELADEYASAKHTLAASTTSWHEYTVGKTAVLQKILRLSDLTADELRSIEDANR